MIIQFILSILVVSGFSILFNGSLQDKGMILSWKPWLMVKLITFGKADPKKYYPYNWIQNAIFQVFVQCPKCLSFWVALFWYSIQYDLYWTNWIEGVEFIVLSVFVTYLLTEKY